MAVQDDAREKYMAEVLGLNHNEDRAGFDAFDGAGRPYELKSASGGYVTTGRDVGRWFLDKLRAAYFIVANTSEASTASRWIPGDFYFLHPDDLEDWISEIETRIEADEVLRDKTVQIVSDNFNDSDIEALTYLVNRGMTINNPKIPWSYILAHGTQLDPQSLPDHLSELVSSRPLRSQGQELAPPPRTRRRPRPSP